MRTRKVSVFQALRQHWRRVTASQLVVWDVGAVTTRVYVGQKLVLVEATCLASNLQTGKLLTYGDAAYRLLGNSGRQLTIQFPADRGCVTDQTAMTNWLVHLRQQLWPRRRWLTGIWAPPGWLCVGEGVGVADLKLWRSTLESAALASVNPVIGLIGLSWYLNLATSDETCFVLDMGGSQTQIGVLVRGTMLASKTLGWGGIDLTTMIQGWLARTYHIQVSWRSAELLKCSSGSLSAQRLTHKKTALTGKDPYTQLGMTASIEVEQLHTMLVGAQQDLLLFIQQFLASVPAEVATKCLENGLWLAGGASQLDGIEQWLGRTIGTTVSRVADPATAASKGVAIWAAAQTARAQTL